MTPQEEQNRKAKLVQQMVNGSEGYKVLMEAFDKRSKELVTALINETDLVTIQNLQAEIKALNLFLKTSAYYQSIQG